MRALALIALPLLLHACATAPLSEERKLSSDAAIGWAEHGGIEAATVEDGLVVVRVDPLVTPVELINPPESSSSIGRLASRLGFSVAINAAMFAKDYVTSIGYMRNYNNINNPRISSKLKGFLLFNPKSSSSPPAKIGNEKDIPAYNTVFQTHRMIDEKARILWKKGASVFRQVGLVGVDKKQRILFFYQPNRADVYETVARILELGLELTGLLYLDGGSHGSLYLAPELGRSRNTWITLPNVLGVKAEEIRE